MILTQQEQLAFQMIRDAARIGARCPTNIELEIATGYESTSMGPRLVARLAEKGMIKVLMTGQRFRQVQICATGECTAAMECRPHVPKGTRQVGRTAITEHEGRYSIKTRAG